MIFRLFLLIILIQLRIVVLGQMSVNTSSRYEVTLLFGNNLCSASRVQLTCDGLLMSANKRIGKFKVKHIVKFIPLKKVVKHLKDGLEIINLFNYIHNAKIMEIDSIKRPPRTKTIKIITQKDTIYKVKLNIFDDRPIMNIRIFNLKTKQSSYLIYGYYDKRIYKLIKLVNEIIPKKYREKYEIRNIWIAGTPIY